MAARSNGDAPAVSDARGFRVRVPGFIADRSVGLGDVIKRATTFVGIRPCGGCERRASALNRRVMFKAGHR
jgi:hypothetical protein